MWGNPRAPVDQSVDRYSYEVKVASSSLAWSKIQFENSIKPYAGHNITGPATPKNFDNLAIVKNLCNSPPFCAIRSSYDQGANFGCLRRDAPRPPMFPHLADLLELCARLSDLLFCLLAHQTSLDQGEADNFIRNSKFFRNFFNG